MPSLSTLISLCFKTKRPRARSRTAFIATGFWLAVLGCSSAMAGDWPQILGPQRNGAAENEKLAATWPAAGPKLLWQRPVGKGFAGPAVSAGKLVIFHRQGGEEIAECLDAAAGTPLWKKSFPTQYVSTISEDDGPRCVPLLHGDNVFLFGASGDLHCLSLKSGEVVWSRAIAQEYQAPEGYFGFGSSPIVEGDKLLLNLGGSRQQAGIVALNVANGKTGWTATDEQASYSSPIATTIDDARTIVFITRLNLVGIDPTNGAVRFRLPFGARGPTVNGANPLLVDGHLFLTASYGVGAVFAKPSKSGVQSVWANGETISSQYATPVAYGGLLYGVDGRQDVGPVRLRCVEPKSGKVLWTEDGFDFATMILADNKLLIQETDGGLFLAEPSPKSFKQLASFSACSSTSRALPALANGRYYVRDETTLRCFDLK